MIAINGWGETISARMPSLAELSTLREDQSPDKLKKLAKACMVSPPAAEFFARKPGAAIKVGSLILQACGAVSDLTVLDEDELDDELAAAFVAAQNKGFESLSVVVARVGSADHRVILRDAREREVDEYMKTESAEAAAKLVRKLCVYPDKLDLEATAPGLYLSLSRFALDRVGMFEDATLGEA